MTENQSKSSKHNRQSDMFSQEQTTNILFSSHEILSITSKMPQAKTIARHRIQALIKAFIVRITKLLKIQSSELFTPPYCMVMCTILTKNQIHLIKCWCEQLILSFLI